MHTRGVSSGECFIHTSNILKEEYLLFNFENLYDKTITKWKLASIIIRHYSLFQHSETLEKVSVISFYIFARLDL